MTGRWMVTTVWQPVAVLGRHQAGTTVEPQPSEAAAHRTANLTVLCAGALSVTVTDPAGGRTTWRSPKKFHSDALCTAY